MSVILELAVGDAAGQTSPADAEKLVAAAQDAATTAIRLVGEADGIAALDPSVIGAYLAGEYPRIGYLIDAATTHNAPYNLARRVLSVDRATGGRVGLVLHPGDGDEVSDAAAPEPHTSGPAADRAARWAEYAQIVTALWESFPATALLGDQAAGIVADDSLIRPIDHDGAFYRVAGPLDGPSSPQGRPVLVAADTGRLGWDRVVDVADAVIVDHTEVDAAELALTTALERIDRSRRDVALLARVDLARADIATADLVRRVSASAAVDGVVVIHRDDIDATIDVIGSITRRSTSSEPRHLRDALGLPHRQDTLR
ncbi:LLM class flavin-dependent oxidoreductase [Gordonia sp. NPDC003376]